MLRLLSLDLDKDVYRPGETVQGKVVLSAPAEGIEISGIYLQLQGTERVRFRASVRNDIDGSTEDISDAFGPSFSGRRYSKRHGFLHHQHYNHSHYNHTATINTGIPTRLPITQPHFMQSTLLAMTVSVTRFRGRLPAGTHTFPFSVTLPTRIPPSFHLASGNSFLAEIAYECTVQVFRPHSSNACTLTLTGPLRVVLGLRRLGSSALPSQLEWELKARHLLCCFPPKQCTMTASWDRSSFSCGQEIPVRAGVSSCAALPSRLSVKLVQELVLNISGHFYRRVYPVAKCKFPGLEGSVVALQIPAGLVPSTQTDAIECKYFLVFEVDWRWAESSLTAAEVQLHQVQE